MISTHLNRIIVLPDYGPFPVKKITKFIAHKHGIAWTIVCIADLLKRTTIHLLSLITRWNSIWSIPIYHIFAIYSWIWSWHRRYLQQICDDLLLLLFLPILCLCFIYDSNTHDSVMYKSELPHISHQLLQYNDWNSTFPRSFQASI